MYQNRTFSLRDGIEIYCEIYKNSTMVFFVIQLQEKEPVKQRREKKKITYYSLMDPFPSSPPRFANLGQNMEPTWTVKVSGILLLESSLFLSEQVLLLSHDIGLQRLVTYLRLPSLSLQRPELEKKDTQSDSFPRSMVCNTIYLKFCIRYRFAVFKLYVHTSVNSSDIINRVFEIVTLLQNHFLLTYVKQRDGRNGFIFRKRLY